MDPIAEFKEAQKKSWAHFAPLESVTTPTAARLITHARVQAGQRVLDVGCGTGVAAVTAARRGASVTGIDLTPELLELARENSRVAEVAVDWHEGDVEQLPFDDGAFDVVVSQYGHMFAPRPDIATAEMIRVLRVGGTLAFSTWPPDVFVGRSFSLVGRYVPAPPSGVSPPTLWGDPNVVRERLGAAVHSLAFDRARMWVPALSPQHQRRRAEASAGPLIRLVEFLGATDPARLAEFRREYEALVGEYWEDNLIRQDYILTRAIKA